MITVLGRLTLYLATTPPGVAPAMEPVRKATAMFLLIALVLGVFLAIVIVSVLAKRVRRRQEARNPAKPSPNLPDPWSEAARRVQPFDSRDQS